MRLSRLGARQFTGLSPYRPFESLFVIKQKTTRSGCFLFNGGMGGIRTRVPLITTTRFPVVLVTTTSIPFRNLFYYFPLVSSRHVFCLSIIPHASFFCNCLSYNSLSFFLTLAFFFPFSVYFFSLYPFNFLLTSSIALSTAFI